MGKEFAGSARGRPRPWDHDYLHLRPLAVDLRSHLREFGPDVCRVLDVGAGGSPYRHAVPPSVQQWLRVDLDPRERPDVVGRAERLPFASGSFDAVVSTQLLGLVDDPRSMVGEIVRVLRPGGRACVSTPGAWPYDSAKIEHRFGEPELRLLFAELTVIDIVRQGGMLALPFALGNVALREALRSLERRFGPLGRPLGWVAPLAYLLLNMAGRLLETLASAGPLKAYLGYLDGRLPMNFLVVAVKRA